MVYALANARAGNHKDIYAVIPAACSLTLGWAEGVSGMFVIDVAIARPYVLAICVVAYESFCP